MALTVGIITYRNAEYLDLCLKSVTENKVLPDTEVLVVVDGFIEECQDVLQKYEGIQVCDLETNRGQTIAHNTAVTLANTDTVLLLNDDNAVGRNFDVKLKDVLREGLVVSVNHIEPQPSIFPSFVLQDFGRTPAEFRYEEFLDYVDGISEALITDDGGTWSPLFYKNDFMRVGGMDVQYPHPSHCDHDLFLKFRLSGLKCVRAHHSPLYHFAKRSESAPEKEAVTAEYFRWKWNYLM